jgi:hypothetical protein
MVESSLNVRRQEAGAIYNNPPKQDALVATEES